MKRIALSLAIWLLIPLTHAWGAEDDLLARAREIFLNNQHWMPATMSIVSREYDRDGNVKSSERAVYRISVDDEGGMISDLVLAEKDGKDITGKRERRGGPPGRSSSAFPNPLDPSLSANVTWEETDAVRMIRGRPCKGFTYRLVDEEENEYIGTMWIDQVSAVPLNVTIGLATLPKIVETFSMEFSYNDDPDAWYATTGEMAGVASIIVVKRRFSVTMDFDNYYRVP